MTHAILLRSTALALSGALATLSLSACNKATAPAQTASATAPTDTTGALGVAPVGAPAGALAPT
ncbi:MAG: hypothetical protein ABI306_00035, partial [Caulobacteraceae bacterium]